MHKLAQLEQTSPYFPSHPQFATFQAGSGVRSARYKKQAGASHVWCNDLNPRVLDTQVLNLLYPNLGAGAGGEVLAGLLPPWLVDCSLQAGTSAWYYLDVLDQALLIVTPCCGF